MIDISKLDKAEVLAALFNASKQQGLGLLNRYGRNRMTKQDAAEVLACGASFDYLQGRVMKVNLEGDEFDPRLYDRDNGPGAAQRAILAIQPALDTGNPAK